MGSFRGGGGHSDMGPFQNILEYDLPLPQITDSFNILLMALCGIFSSLSLPEAILAPK